MPVTTNANEMVYRFQAFGSDVQTAVRRDALKSLGKMLVDSTRRNMGATPMAGKTRGVKMRVDEYEGLVTVNILGHPLLRIFEVGAAQRSTESCANRGSIREYGFFRNARNEVEPQARRVIEQFLINAIKKHSS